jgi:hypothetical protein
MHEYEAEDGDGKTPKAVGAVYLSTVAVCRTAIYPAMACPSIFRPPHLTSALDCILELE